jgi:hypothetical protein
MSSSRLVFHVHPERLAIVRLPSAAELPDWVGGSFESATRTPQELSIVCPQTRVPRELTQERDKLALGIEGVIPMTTVGLLAGLCAALAAAQVPVFAISTYDTDWLLVSADKLADAVRALEGAGHRVLGSLPAH